ncbi:CaiB/BaiF CoA transferase family protein [Streptomyces sp. NPDC090106]|uniref:CaiB/BaiF CoA transferase family protein n=1 Tax=Streptomyces sp. NPDC090106 TaxID=3365946 RepID=UPI00382EE571
MPSQVPLPAGPVAPPGPLAGLTVLDCATLFAGPLAATVLGDYGADVIKIEHPGRPDPARTHGPARDGTGLWWKMLGRNKHTVTLDLSRAAGARILLRLAAQADVLIENFRPGTLERWGLSPERLHETNPGLVIARVTGFGQFGPYARRPGFGTLAESMSGFAAITGEPDGPPTLPPFGLADGVAALVTASAVQTALLHRARHRAEGGDGGGQVVDLAIVEPLLTLLGPQATAYDQLGTVPARTGNRSANNAPRNTYRTRDDRWVAVSTSAQSVAERVLRLVGHPEVTEEPWFATGSGRAAHADLLDGHVGDWIAARDLDDVVKSFTEADAAICPVYDIRDVFADPQYRALDSITTVQDPELGPLRMQNVLYRLSATPGSIRWTGRPHGADTAAVYRDRLGLTDDELRALAEEGTV